MERGGFTDSKQMLSYVKSELTDTKVLDRLIADVRDGRASILIPLVRGIHPSEVIEHFKRGLKQIEEPKPLIQVTGPEFKTGAVNYKEGQEATPYVVISFSTDVSPYEHEGKVDWENRVVAEEAVKELLLDMSKLFLNTEREFVDIDSMYVDAYYLLFLRTPI